jgi:pimeloyl-ACP methyl ester carboxylesterase
MFSSPEGQAEYLACYDAVLREWPVAFEPQQIETRFGMTYVIACGRRDGPPLLLLHGLSASSTMWFANAGVLGQDFRVYAIDFPGDVNRSVPGKPPYSRASCARWLGEVLDGLGLRTASIAGLSFGGYLAFNFALAHPERVNRLVLLSPAASLAPIRLEFYSRLLLMLVSRQRGGNSFFRWLLGARYSYPEAFRQQRAMALRHGRARWIAIPVVFSDEELRRFQVSSLVLFGEHEVLCDVRRASQRARRLMANAEVDVVPGAGHMLPMEQPELINSRMRKFLLAPAASSAVHIF